MNINYRINKNKIIKNFKEYTSNHTDKDDLYKSKGKEVQYRSDYVILEKIKSIYVFVINKIKMDLRREFIHDDKSFEKVMNMLNDRVNNKIRSKDNGKIYISVGTNDPVYFYGDDDQYKTLIIHNKNKQAQVIRRLVDELNAVLSGDAPEEENKLLINSNDYILEDVKEPVHIVNKLFENINKKIISDIFEGNFSDFDRFYFDFIKEQNITLDSAKIVLEKIHDIFINSNKPLEIYNNIIKEDDPPKQIYKRFSDPGLENRREKSMDVLKGRGLTASGGGWHNKRGELVATIGDKGEIVWKNNTLSKQPPQGTGQSGSSLGPSGDTEIPDQQTTQEPEIETGLSDKELEYIRKMNESTVSV